MKIVRTPKILIIEDQLIIAADIQLQLEQLGYQVIGINHCAKDALLTISKTRPDFVLIDVGLGGDDSGIEVAQEILSQIAIPILFLSYSIDRPLFQKIVQTKPYAFIPKPFQLMDLEKGIQTALERIARESTKLTNIKPCL